MLLFILFVYGMGMLKVWCLFFWLWWLLDGLLLINWLVIMKYIVLLVKGFSVFMYFGWLFVYVVLFSSVSVRFSDKGEYVCIR